MAAVNIRKKTGLPMIILVSISLILVIPHLASATESIFNWSKPRPSKDRTFLENIGNATTDGTASLTIGVGIAEYHEDEQYIGGEDLLGLNISISANSREWIDYEWSSFYSYGWCETTQPLNITGDDSGVWLDIPSPILFYGIEYEKIWVCSNGFIALDKNYTSLPPQSIPSNQEPNAFIAVFCRNLHPEMGGSITWEEYVYFNGESFFAISWNNVPDDDGYPQTFQVLIKYRAGWLTIDLHSEICFQYKNVTKNRATTIGIEDQLGRRGEFLNLDDIHNGFCRTVYVQNRGYRLQQLTLRIHKNDTNAKIQLLSGYIGGYNVILQNYNNPYGCIFASAIGFAADLLIGYYVEGAKTAIMLSTLVITGQTAFELSQELSPPQLFEANLYAGPGDNEAYIKTECAVENQSEIYSKPFDSTLAASIMWLFLDPNDVDHSITITAEAMYASLDNIDVRHILTSVTLNMYIGDHYLDINTRVSGTEIDIPNVKVWIDGTVYYSPAAVIVSPGIHTVQVETSFIIDEYLFRFDGWSDQIEENPRVVYLYSDKSLTAYYNVTYVRTCPTLFVWNGSGYVYEALLDIHASSDVTLLHQIQQPLVRDGYLYKLELRELDDFTSHIDQVKLYAVSSNGEIHPCILVSAIHNKKGCVTSLLAFDDDIRVDLAPTETIELKFIYFGINVDHFIFKINGYNRKWPG